MVMTFEDAGKYLQDVSKSLEEKMKTDAEKVKVYAANQEQAKILGSLSKELYDEKRGIIPQLNNAAQHAVTSNPDGLARTAINAYNIQDRIKGLKEYVSKARGKFKEALYIYLLKLYTDAQKILDTVRGVANTPLMAPQVDATLKQYHAALGR
jgi:hypothetical protein